MYERCKNCQHLECLHRLLGNSKDCTLCKCSIRVWSVEPEEDNEKDSAEYWVKLDR